MATEATETSPVMSYLQNTNTTSISVKIKLIFTETSHTIKLPIYSLTLDYNSFKAYIFQYINQYLTTSPDNPDELTAETIDICYADSDPNTEIQSTENCPLTFPLINIPKFRDNPNLLLHPAAVLLYVRPSNYLNNIETNIIYCSICFNNFLEHQTTMGYTCQHPICISCYNQTTSTRPNSHTCPCCRQPPRITPSHLQSNVDYQNNEELRSQRTTELLSIWRTTVSPLLYT